MNPTILTGDSLTWLRTLPDEHVQCCVTSPPYWALRDYGTAGQMGFEKTPEEYVAKMVEVFREVRRVLKSDGTLWLNLGDSYARSGGTQGGGNRELMHMEGTQSRMCKIPVGSNLKSKDLVGIPWMLAFALRADGWYLRCDIIWAKANCMPESVTDRPTKSHEYLFLLSKLPKYYYNHEAIKEPASLESAKRDTRAITENDKNVNGAPGQTPHSLKKPRPNDKQRGHSRPHAGFNARWDEMEKDEQCTGMRNKRDVWTIATADFPDAHFATYPPKLIKPCILAGTKPGDTVLDPFAGSGTTGMVAIELGRKATLIEINPEYVKLIRQRCNVTPGLAL